MMLLIMFSILLFLLSINVPIAIGIAITTVIAMVINQGPSFLIDTAIVMFDGSMKFPLIAIPLFILAGSIMNSAGISRRFSTNDQMLRYQRIKQHFFTDTFKAKEEHISIRDYSRRR